jgi:hypothetical protein
MHRRLAVLRAPRPPISSAAAGGELVGRVDEELERAAAQDGQGVEPDLDDDLPSLLVVQADDAEAGENPLEDADKPAGRFGVGDELDKNLPASLDETQIEPDKRSR